MIAFVKGKLIVKEPSYVIVDVSGVGYHVRVSLNTYSRIGDDSDILLHTHLHVKEDAHTLYGFYEEEERQIFQQLISISGVGPNTALMLLSSLRSEELKSAIVNGQVNVIQSVKGIGGKTAQRIILELKDKLPDEVFSETEIKSAGSGNTLKNEALSALLTLGYTKAAGEKAIDKVMREQGGNLKLEDLIKFVLKSA